MIRLCVVLLACLSCTVTPYGPAGQGERVAFHPENGALLDRPHDPLRLESARLEPAPRTVEDHWLLHLYTRFHARDYASLRVAFPGTERPEAVAYLLLPPGEGPHPAVLVFPILAGSHVVSEALAKALVSHGFAVARLERAELDLGDPTVSLSELRLAIAGAVHDARRLVDFLTSQPRIDAGRLASAGVSLGGLQALLLAAVDARIRGGFFVMTGGGLAELIWDSEESPVRSFRERLRAERDLATREAFVAALRSETRDVDPLTYAGKLDPRTVLLVSGRFDRVVPPARTEELWEALGRPRRIHLPVGHYQLFPFFWWSVARGADHLDRVFAGALPGE